MECPLRNRIPCGMTIPDDYSAPPNMAGWENGHIFYDA
jgi:hypothetical protein